MDARGGRIDRRASPGRRAGVLGALGLTLLLACTSGSRAVSSFGPLKVGQPVPTIRAITRAGHDLPTPDQWGDVQVYVVDDRLPAVCLDHECGPQAEAVVEHDGHLLGFSDQKAARIFGVEPDPEVPKCFRTSLVVLTDPHGTITSIHAGATLKDVPAIVEQALVTFVPFGE